MIRRTAAAVLAAFFLLLAGAAPAYAHAELLATTPAAGSRVDAAPERATLTFSESVEVAFGAIRVYDERGDRVDTGASRHPDGHGSEVAVDVRPLEPGGYVVTWRVVSSDSHPVHGAFTFRVGPSAADPSALAARLLADQGGSSVVGGLFAVVRLLAFAAVVLLVGGGFLAAALWPGGLRDRRALRLLRAAAVSTAVTSVIGLGLQGAYAGALPLRDAVRPAVLRAVLDTRFGQAWALRAVLALVALVLLARWSRVAAALTGLALAATVVWPGHAGAGMQVPLALASDGVHVLAASLWLGGLALLAACVLRDPDALRVTVPRFSRLAFGCVVALVVTGSYQSWRGVGTLPALWRTTYGQLLIAKLAGFAVLVGLGYLGRRWVRSRATDAKALRRSVLGEVGVGAAVLTLTALLVNVQPARSAYATPFSTTVTAEQTSVNLVVDPAKAGRPADLHAYTLTPAGQIAEVAELTGTLRLASRDIGPLKVPFVRAGPGHFVASDFEIPIAGQWQLDVTVRTTEVDQVTVSATVPIR